jgi:hypothetical protein
MRGSHQQIKRHQYGKSYPHSSDPHNSYVEFGRCLHCENFSEFYKHASQCPRYVEVSLPFNISEAVNQGSFEHLPSDVQFQISQIEPAFSHSKIDFKREEIQNVAIKNNFGQTHVETKTGCSHTCEIQRPQRSNVQKISGSNRSARCHFVGAAEKPIVSVPEKTIQDVAFEVIYSEVKNDQMLLRKKFRTEEKSMPYSTEIYRPQPLNFSHCSKSPTRYQDHQLSTSKLPKRKSSMQIDHESRNTFKTEVKENVSNRSLSSIENKDKIANFKKQNLKLSQTSAFVPVCSTTLAQKVFK